MNFFSTFFSIQTKILTVERRKKGRVKLPVKDGILLRLVLSSFSSLKNNKNSTTKFI